MRNHGAFLEISNINKVQFINKAVLSFCILLSGIFTLNGCTTAIPTILTATNPPSETPTLFPTSTVTQTPTATATPTPEPTYAVSGPEYEHAMVEWDKTTLELGNDQMLDYVIGVEPGFDISTVWGQLRTESIEVNEDLANHEQILADVISHSLYEAYLVKGSQISYEEFMKNPQWYPIPLVMPDGQGGFVTKPFTLNQINRIEQCWVSRKDPRLYLRVQSLSSAYPYGYELTDNGATLVLFANLPNQDSVLQAYLRVASDHPHLDVALGSQLGEAIITGLLVTGYSYIAAIKGSQPRVDIDFVSHYKAVKSSTGYPPEIPNGTYAYDGVTYYATKGLFVAKLTPKVIE